MCSRKMLEEKERIMIEDKGSDISFLSRDNICGGILNGLEDLSRLREKIQSLTSILLVGDKKIDSETGFFK